MKSCFFAFIYAVEAIHVNKLNNSALRENMKNEWDLSFEGRQRTTWQLAAIEAGILDKMPGKQLGWGAVPQALEGKVSYYGFNIPKFPKSWVEKVIAMDTNKTIRYMFSGSFTHIPKLKYRKWLPNFVMTHFGPGDYFRATDADTGYTPMGEFDKSMSEKGFRPKSSCKMCMEFDETYWSKMVQSKFIIAPGGDAPYSFRFYESALARAIPIINNVDTDWHPGTFIGDHMRSIGYNYLMTTDAHDYDEKVAILNFKKFIRYQTFIEGDNDPEYDKKTGLYPTF